LRTYSKPKLFVRKVDALSGRLDGKDAFDLWGMWNKGIAVKDVRRSLDGYAKSQRISGEKVIADALRNIEKMSSNVEAVENAASHFIPRSARPNWRLLLADVSRFLDIIASCDL